MAEKPNQGNVSWGQQLSSLAGRVISADPFFSIPQWFVEHMPGLPAGFAPGSTIPGLKDGTGLQVKLVSSASPNAPQTKFWISENAEMPKDIEAVCTLPAGMFPTGTNYTWDVTLEMDLTTLPSGKPKSPDPKSKKKPVVRRTSTTHPPIRQTTSSPNFTIPFTYVRGGKLTVKVTVDSLHGPVSATQTAEIRGKEPSLQQISNQVKGAKGNGPAILMQILLGESKLHQFFYKGEPRDKPGNYEGYPLMSSDRLDGVGLGQITYKIPTEDEVWNWKENLKEAVKHYNDSYATAGSFFRKYESRDEFKTLVKGYNDAWLKNIKVKPGQPTPEPPKIKMADPKDKFVEDETIRGYNGFGSTVNPVHEYRAEMDWDTQQNVTYQTVLQSKLNVTVSADGKSGTVKWHQVSKQEREGHYQALGIAKEHWGDTNYVDQVRQMTAKK
jgi:hypothetical protein